MKRIEAIIQPKRRDDVKDALKKINLGLTFFDGQGCGDARISRTFRGQQYEIEILPRVLIVVFAADHLVDQVCQAILTNARTGEKGDGMIVVSDISRVISISTGESGPTACAFGAASP